MPNLILRCPNLWIGDRDDSLDKKWFQEKKVTAVFNCTPDLLFRPNAGVTLQYRLSLHDDPDDIPVMTRRLPAAVRKLAAARAAGHNVLVHCRAGQQRSACLVAAYILYVMMEAKQYWISVNDVVHFIRRYRKQAFSVEDPSKLQVNFRKSLVAYHKLLKEKHKLKRSSSKGDIDVNARIRHFTRLSSSCPRSSKHGKKKVAHKNAKWGK